MAFFCKIIVNKSTPLPGYVDTEREFLRMKPSLSLKIYISDHCPGCDEAIEIAGHIEQEYAGVVTVEVIDIARAQADVPDRVFATPTFMLNNRIVSLGNPSLEDVARWVREATSQLA